MGLTRFRPVENPTKSRSRRQPPSSSAELIPQEASQLELEVEGRTVKLTNLQKPFWPQLGISKGDLLRYYAEVSSFLLPHLRDRAMVMKRYPNGAAGKFFFQKRAPEPRPDWIEICSIKHASASVIDFPIVRDLASLLWLVNLGCIDLNPKGRVLVDYNQNAWGRTLASVYSVRPTAQATVSTPVSWEEVQDGIEIEDF